VDLDLQETLTRGAGMKLVILGCGLLACDGLNDSPSALAGVAGGYLLVVGAWT